MQSKGSLCDFNTWCHYGLMALCGATYLGYPAHVYGLATVRTMPIPEPMMNYRDSSNIVECKVFKIQTYPFNRQQQKLSEWQHAKWQLPVHQVVFPKETFLKTSYGPGISIIGPRSQADWRKYAYNNRRVSQTGALLATCRELAMDYNTLPELPYVFKHKT